MTMSMCLPLSALKGAPLSTWWRTDTHYRKREIAWTNGWCWFTRARARWHKHVCRVLASAAPQAGHVAAKCSSISRCRRPAYRNSWAGMTR